MPLTTLDDRTALVVVDLQNGVRTRPAAPHPVDDVIAHTGELATAFRAHGLPVVLVRYTTDGSDATPGRTDMSGRTQPSPPEGWDEIVDALAGPRRTSLSPNATGVPSTARTWTSSCGGEASRRSC